MPDLNNFQSADHILVRYADTGTYNVYFTKLEQSDLNNIVGYVTDKVTIDYTTDKLTHKPTFSDIAFTGDINDLTDKNIGALNTAFSDEQVIELSDRLNLNDLKVTLPEVPRIPQDEVMHNKFYKENPITHEITSEIKDFNPIAVNGVTYSDIINAPSIAAGTYANQQGQSATAHDFHKVAFSGEYSDLQHLPDIDGRFANVPTIPSNQMIRSLFFNEIDTGEVDENEDPIYEQVIKNFDPIAVNGITYTTLSGAPSIEAGTYANEEGEDPIDHDFHKVAFSGEYSDLENLPDLNNLAINYDNIIGAPALPERAYQTYNPYSQEWSNLTDGEVAPFNKIAFGDLSELTASTFTNNYIVDMTNISNNLTLLHTLGEESNLSGWFDYSPWGGNDSIIYSNFSNMYFFFVNFNKTVIFKTINRNYILESAYKTPIPNYNDASHFFYTFILTPYYADNFLTLLNTYNTNTNSNSDSILANLSIGNSIEKKLVIVLDNPHSKLYWKTVTNPTT